MLDRGKFDRLITFQRATITRSSLGVEKPTWGDLQQARAMVRFGTSQERREASVEGASQVATFRVLSTTALRTVTEKDRIVFDTRNWNITGSAPVGGPASEIEFTAILAKG